VVAHEVCVDWRGHATRPTGRRAGGGGHGETCAFAGTALGRGGLAVGGGPVRAAFAGRRHAASSYGGNGQGTGGDGAARQWYTRRTGRNTSPVARSQFATRGPNRGFGRHHKHMVGGCRIAPRDRKSLPPARQRPFS